MKFTNGSDTTSGRRVIAIPMINAKMDDWAEKAKTGEEFEMVEQTWTLAADMICKALFDRDMPFNPHFVFKCVKTYTDVTTHKSIRLKKNADSDFEVTDAERKWLPAPQSR